MKRPAASALLIVLWAVIVLTFAVFAWVKIVSQDLQVHGSASQTLEARAMAHSGITLALHPRVKKETPLLEGGLGDGLTWRVRISSEGGKLNLNWIAGNEKDPRVVNLLKQWLTLRGLTFHEREVFTDCLFDYIDADNLHRANGAEDEGNYHAANRPLQTVDELAAVKGSGPLVSQPGWQDQLTRDSTGQIDILAASPEILGLLPGFSDARIKRFVQLRAGKDGLQGTADDPAYQNLAQPLTAIGFSQAEITALNGIAMINDPVVHIYSTGRSGKVVRQVEVVARKGASNPLILSWKE